MTRRSWLSRAQACLSVLACSVGGCAQSTDDAPQGELCPPCDGCEEQVPISPSEHAAGDLDYADRPPSSGDHNACWADWGAHEEAVPDEQWVHNLEHGGVVFLYDCEADCAPQVKQLAQFVNGRDRALLTPYDALSTRFAVVSWGHRLQTDCLDQALFQAFYAMHVGRGPESVSAGPPAGCR